MRIYLAPMEGLTGYVFRKAYHHHFSAMDRYFTPFIANKGLSHRELHDVLPENNPNMTLIPQILTNRADDFLEICRRLREFGYKEVNLNLGCPSGTVAAKGRGAGFLAYPEALRCFLDEIFMKADMKISIKTRIGIESDEEWPKLLQLYRQYPLSELIIHPRVLKDFYRNTPRIEAYQAAMGQTLFPLCYNGDIDSVDKWQQIRDTLGISETEAAIMLGRGVLSDPFLTGKLRGENAYRIETLEAFHNEILDGYCEEMSGDRNVLFRMKELWVYLEKSLVCPPKIKKQLQKSTSVREYRNTVSLLFSMNHEMRK